MTTRFVYREKSKGSIWPTLFKLMGRTLFDAPNVQPDEQRIEQFEKYLMEGDAPADEAARDLFMTGSNHAKNFRLMNKVLEDGLNEDDDVPVSFQDLIQRVNEDPAWLDRDQVERGAAVCRRLGVHAMAVLGDLALVGGYANPDITRPLIFTGALKGARTFDRVSETSQFWVEVTRKGALGKGRKGFRTAIRVRMMHAIVRQRLLQHPKWDSKSWGLPINKADSMATNLAFSMAMIYGCKFLGFHLPNKDIEAVLHLWRYLGFLLGDDPEWLPTTAEEGLQCLHLIHLSNRNEPDEECKSLARDYIESFKPKTGMDDNWQQFLVEHYLYWKRKAYARFLIPPDLYSRLELPAPNLSWLLVPLVETPVIFTLDRLRSIVPGMGKWMEEQGAKAQELVVTTRMGDKEATFIPSEKMGV
jgi:hypothetical protein